VALGYRKNVNLAQIRTFTEMDSHEEKVYEAMRKSQEKEARDEMKRRAKELQMARKEASKRGGKAFNVGGGFGSSDYTSGPSIDMSTSHQPSKPAYNAPSRPQRAGGGSALKLKKKDKDVDSFVDKLVREGERVTSVTAPRQPSVTAKTTVSTPQASVHLKVTERLSVVAGRDGGLQSMELLGMVMLRISEQQFSKIRVMVDNRDQRSLQFQTHPNVDKALWNSEGQLGLKQPNKPFPLQQEVGVLKWRMQTTDESLMPLTVNCWPSENAGKCEVNIEYELQQPELELTDVIISIPCP
jgi:predicted RNA-binding protein Jag